MNIKKIQMITRAGILSLAVVFATGAGLALADYDLSGENDTTGPNSENENEWEIDEEIEIEIENDLDIDNDFDIEVETGNNDIKDNTEVDDVETGDIEGDIEVVNDFGYGSNTLLAVGELGDIDVSFVNHLTGPNSENENEVEIDRKVEIDIDNDVEIDNDVDLDLNTGKNDVEDNTVVGDVTTGDIEVNYESENRVGLGTRLDLETLTNSDISADFSNDTTGPNSENTNELEIESKVDVDVENDVEIKNDLDVDANTGENDIEDNTCVGDITTGSVRFDFSTVNIVR